MTSLSVDFPRCVNQIVSTLTSQPWALQPQNTGGTQHSCGFCSFGCPYGEKQGGVVTWLRDAADHGAKFMQGTRVDRLLFSSPSNPIKPTSSNVDTLHSSATSTRAIGALVTDSFGRKAIIHARQAVVVSGGAIHTPALLLRSGLKNRAIGRNLHLHPTTFATGYFSENIKPWEGSIMTTVRWQQSPLGSRQVYSWLRNAGFQRGRGCGWSPLWVQAGGHVFMPKLALRCNGRMAWKQGSQEVGRPVQSFCFAYCPCARSRWQVHFVFV